MNTMPKSILGRTGLEVTKLGYGAMELRGTDHFPRLGAAQAAAILNRVLDNGINYIDTCTISIECVGQSQTTIIMTVHRNFWSQIPFSEFIFQS